MNRVIFYAVIMPLAMIGALTLVVRSTSMPDYFGQAERSSAEFRAKLDAAGKVDEAKIILTAMDKEERELADERRRFDALAASASCPLHIRMELGDVPHSYKMLELQRVFVRVDADSIVKYGPDKARIDSLDSNLKKHIETLNNHSALVARLSAHLTKNNYGVTMDAYNAIKPGMALSEVEEVIGPSCPPKEISRAGSFVTYVWGDKSGGIVAAFDGDRLVSKSQLGL